MKNKICAVFLSLSLLLSGGCWDYRELNTLTIVSALALDKTQEGTIALTAELAQGGKESSQAEGRLTQGEGHSCPDAVCAAGKKGGRPLYLGHTQAVAVSTQLARQGLEPVLDYLSRQRDIPLSLSLVVSCEDTAAKLLKTPPLIETLAGYEIARAASETSQPEPVMPLYRFYSQMREAGIDPWLPAVGAGEKGIHARGAALFRDSRLVGFLNEDETDILYLLQGLTPAGGITVSSPSGKGGDVTFTLTSCRSALRTGLSPEGQVEGVLSLRAEAAVSQLEGEQPLLSPQGREQLSHLCAAALERRCYELLQKLQQEFACDPLGVGLDLSRRCPEQWAACKDQWPQLFSQGKLCLSVQLQLASTGRTYRSPSQTN